jgi:hypothetical protein
MKAPIVFERTFLQGLGTVVRKDGGMRFEQENRIRTDYFEFVAAAAIIPEELATTALPEDILGLAG